MSLCCSSNCSLPQAVLTQSGLNVLLYKELAKLTYYLLTSKRGDPVLPPPPIPCTKVLSSDCWIQLASQQELNSSQKKKKMERDFIYWVCLGCKGKRKILPDVQMGEAATGSLEELRAFLQCSGWQWGRWFFTLFCPGAKHFHQEFLYSLPLSSQVVPIKWWH